FPRVSLPLLGNGGPDLPRAIFLVVDLHLPVCAHVALDGPDGALDIRDGLALGALANQALAPPRERHHGGGGPGAFGVRDNGGLSTFEYGDDGVGCSEVNA